MIRCAGGPRGREPDLERLPTCVVGLGGQLHDGAEGVLGIPQIR